mgnify:CR=1 FL=1
MPSLRLEPAKLAYLQLDFKENIQNATEGKVYVKLAPGGQIGAGGALVQKVQNGTIQGMNIPAGAPASAVTRAYANMGGDITTLDFTEEQLKKVNSEFDLWTPYEIPAETYPNQTEAINTIAQPNILAVRADVPADHVYALTKAMYENLPFLNNIHPATKAMALEKAIAGLPMPLHEGAARYFKEQGLEIPERLQPVPAE